MLWNITAVPGHRIGKPRNDNFDCIHLKKDSQIINDNLLVTTLCVYIGSHCFYIIFAKLDYDFTHSFFFMWLQGYLPVEASVLDVEVWGLGGEATRRQQDVYKKRENIFSEQRRKVLPRAKLNHSRCMSLPKCAAMPMIFPIFLFQVDLKTFGNWEDSPEKMMMDMTSDPNRVRREDRWILFCVKKSSANVQWLPVHENGEYWSSSPRGDVEKSVHIFACPFVGHTWHVIEVV